MEDKAKEYTEKQYYKVDDIDEFNGEPLAVYRAYKQCQEDMANKKYTEEDMYNCWQTAFTDAMNITKKDYKPIWYSDFINSLTKQD